MEKQTFTFDYISRNHSQFFGELIHSSQNFILVDHEKHGLCLLVIRRADHLRHFPGEICPVGGKIDPGHHAVKTARKETKEEIGLKIYHIRKFGEVVNPFGNKVNFFCSKISQEDLESIKLDFNESSAAALIPISCLRGYKTEAEITDCTYDKYQKVQLPKFK